MPLQRCESKNCAVCITSRVAMPSAQTAILPVSAPTATTPSVKPPSCSIGVSRPFTNGVVKDVWSPFKTVPIAHAGSNSAPPSLINCAIPLIPGTLLCYSMCTRQMTEHLLSACPYQDQSKEVYYERQVGSWTRDSYPSLLIR